MADEVFDLYDREKLLLAEGQAILEHGSPEELQAFAERLFDRFSKLVRENEDLTRHSDRQEQRLVKLNRNLKTQTLELEQQRSRLEGLSQPLAKYLPPQIHEALFAGKYDTQITTQRKKLTVFFSDIKDFTRTAESLQPESLTEFLNDYFSEMTAIALSHGATIDKYIGDAVMLFFGDPESKGVKEDARACVEMALEMQARMLVLQRRWREQGFDNPFVIRIGINTGYCNVGNFGSDQRLSYTIIGREVNIAQRLESQAEPGGILLSYETFVHVQDMVSAEERQSIRLKGIAQEVKAFAVKNRLLQTAEQVLSLHDPKGVSIDLHPSTLDHDARVRLAQSLRGMAAQLEGSSAAN
jgi:class 3 adenylate cyclase